MPRSPSCSPSDRRPPHCARNRPPAVPEDQWITPCRSPGMKARSLLDAGLSNAPTGGIRRLSRPGRPGRDEPRDAAAREGRNPRGPPGRTHLRRIGHGRFLLEVLQCQTEGWLALERRAVMSEDAPASPHLLRLSGFVLVAAGVLMAVATPLHPSRETATTIIASEVRLVAAHVLSTLSSLLVLLGLPGLYVAQRTEMGRLGFVGFL